MLLFLQLYKRYVTESSMQFFANASIISYCNRRIQDNSQLLLVIFKMSLSLLTWQTSTMFNSL